MFESRGYSGSCTCARARAHTHYHCNLVSFSHFSDPKTPLLSLSLRLQEFVRSLSSVFEKVSSCPVDPLPCPVPPIFCKVVTSTLSRRPGSARPRHTTTNTASTTNGALVRRRLELHPFLCFPLECCVATHIKHTITTPSTATPAIPIPAIAQ